MIAPTYNILPHMPQLVPFYYSNQINLVLTLLVVFIYVCCKYMLPRFIRLFTTRVQMAKFQ